jgi:hypothetical protein
MVAEVETVQLANTNDTIDVQAVTVGGALLYVATRYMSGKAASSAIAFAPAGGAALPSTKLTTLNATTGSLPAGAITGADVVTLISSNAVPGAQLVRSAAAMLGDIGAGVGAGYSYRLTILNTGAGTLTLTADAGATVTMTGTMTVPQNTTRSFVVVFNTATTATITAVGTGTYS